MNKFVFGYKFLSLFTGENEYVCTNVCCKQEDCDLVCEKQGSGPGLGICKPDEACQSGGLCCCVA